MKKVILNGWMGTGKTELALGIQQELGHDIHSIGTAIKKTTSLLIDDPATLKHHIQVISQNKQVTENVFHALTEEIKTYQHEAWVPLPNGLHQKTSAYRGLTQFVGTTLRKELGNGVFGDFLLLQLQEEKPKDALIVIDDLRLRSEKESFEKEQYISIRLDISREEQAARLRNAYGHEMPEDQLYHFTETDLDNETFDFRFDSSHLSIEEVKNKVVTFLKSIK